MSLLVLLALATLGAAGAGYASPGTAPVDLDVGVVWAGATNDRRVALTFDDGPRAGVTDRVLDQLGDVGARATFFVLGERIERAGPDGARLLRRIVADGHEIGNHTWSHASITRLSRSKVLDEIERTQRGIEAVTGERPTLFRPPGGDISVSKLREIAETDIRTVVLWSIDPSDWADKPQAEIWRHIADRAEPGSIILLHDIHPETARALPLLLDLLQARGFELVTVSELLARRSR